MRKFISWIVLHTFLLFILFPQEHLLQAQKRSKITIAVLKIDTRGGVTQNEAATLADRLSTELVNMKVYTVVERAKMQDILKEQGFNLSGCTSSECAVEAGRLLGVQQMVAGNIGKIGNVLTVDIRVFDVGTGQIVKAHQFNHKGDVSGLLKIMRKVAEKITTTQQQQKKGFPWLWVSVGAVVVAGGAVAALVMGGGGDDQETPSTALPDPDWPPN